MNRPPDSEIEERFQELLENRDMDSAHVTPSHTSSRSSMSTSQASIAKSAAALPIETKWQMVESDARAKYENARKSRRKEAEMIKSGKVKKGGAPAVDKDSPEWYLKKILDGTITAQHLSTLNVSLRTFPLT
jgi:cytokinesis protein